MGDRRTAPDQTLVAHEMGSCKEQRAVRAFVGAHLMGDRRTAPDQALVAHEMGSYKERRIVL